jgi:hypothetical protein
MKTALIAMVLAGACGSGDVAFYEGAPMPEAAGIEVMPVLTGADTETMQAELVRTRHGLGVRSMNAASDKPDRLDEVEIRADGVVESLVVDLPKPGVTAVSGHVGMLFAIGEPRREVVAVTLMDAKGRPLSTLTLQGRDKAPDAMRFLDAKDQNERGVEAFSLRAPQGSLGRQLRLTPIVGQPAPGWPVGEPAPWGYDSTDFVLRDLAWQGPCP